jgi:hypothetical protein
LQCSFGFLFCIEHDPTKKAWGDWV